MADVQVMVRIASLTEALKRAKGNQPNWLRLISVR